MAARTSTSVGAWIAITVTSILAFAFGVTSIISYSRLNSTRNDLSTLQDSTRTFIDPGEEGLPKFQRALNRARSPEGDDPRRSLAGYLMNELEVTKEFAFGPNNDARDVRELRDFVATRVGELGPSESLLGRLVSLGRTNDALRQQLEGERAARQRADDAALAEASQLRAVQTEYNDRLGQLTSQYDALAASRDELAARAQSLQNAMDERVERTRVNASQREAELNRSVATLQEQVTVLQRQVEILREDVEGTRISPRPEESLADGEVIAVAPETGEAVISVGRAQRVVLGLTFAVYDSASSIRVNADGEYPRGKAVLEVISVQSDSARCRIIEQSLGNPVISGDVIANAAYDPSKTYRFLVYGNFDSNGDGRATRFETDAIKALIAQWQGVVIDDAQATDEAALAEVDFLVLGERPPLPPQPAFDAPVALVEEYIRQQRLSLNYDAFFRAARDTKIPVLNENRLRTLIGDFPR